MQWIISQALLTLLLPQLYVNGLTSGSPALQDSTCERISVPMCLDIGYGLTRMPNTFGHRNQDEAALETHEWYPLVKINCSPQMKFFICLQYAPICIQGYPFNIPPCREVCESARDGCSPIMAKFGFDWPETMDCQRFPLAGDKTTFCVSSQN